MIQIDTEGLLALNFSVDKQHHQRANYRNDKATEIKPVNLAKAKEGADPAAHYRTDDPQNDSDEKAGDAANLLI